MLSVFSRPWRVPEMRQCLHRRGKPRVPLLPLCVGLTALAIFAAASPARAAVALYRLYSGNKQLLTTSQSERDQLVSGGWTLMGTIGEVCATGAEESMLVPFYRLYRSAIGAAYYTANVDERNSVLASGGWVDQGIACYVYQSDDTARMPLFRAFNNQTSQYLFTCDRAEYNALSWQWYRAGIAAYIKTNAAPLFPGE